MSHYIVRDRFHSLDPIPNHTKISQVLITLFSYRIKIEDARYGRDDLAAWACIRLDRLQQGYRFVNLLDEKGNATSGLLLIKVDKKLR